MRFYSFSRIPLGLVDIDTAPAVIFFPPGDVLIESRGTRQRKMFLKPEYHSLSNDALRNVENANDTANMREKKIKLGYFKT